MATQDDRITEFHRLHASGLLRDAEPVGRRQRAGPGAAGLPGAGDDERRAWRGRWARRHPGHASTRRSSTCAPSRRRRRAGERRLPGRLRGRARRASRRTSRWPPRPASPGSRSRTPSGDADRSAATTSTWRSSGSGRAAGDRRQRHRRRAHRPLRGLRRRAPRHRRDDPAAPRLRRGRRRLPLRPADRPGRARRRDRRRGGAQAGQPADQRPVHHGRGGGRSSAYGGSASAARSRARPGAACWTRRRRSPKQARSPASTTCRTSTP